MTNSTTTVQGAAGGLSFAAEIKGEPGAMPVLLAHGGGQTRQAWKGVTDDLANTGFRALARHAWARGQRPEGGLSSSRHRRPPSRDGAGHQMRAADLYSRNNHYGFRWQAPLKRQGRLHIMKHLLAGLMACALTLAACSGSGADSEATQELEQGPREVRTAVVESELLAEPVKAFGTIAAKQSSAIGALTQGLVERIFVNVGDRVSRGQPLFRIRQADYRRRVAEEQAAVDLVTAQAIEAERRYERVMALAPKGFVSKAQVDVVETGLAVARAQKAQAQAALETAQQSLNDTIRRAPYDGVVTARLVDEGVYLNNQFSMGGQSAALELQELGVVAAIVNAPQKYVDVFRRNMPARVFIEGFDEPFGSIVYVINDRVDPESRMVELRLPIANPNYRISSGLAARAEIEVPPEPAITLPRTAIMGDSASSHLFVVADGKALRREVTFESIDLNRVRIRSGLKVGDEVILDPPATLRDAEPVRARRTTGET